jgi:acyl-coenzyme A synthetase/AMP-(fatty) acid ligase
LVTRPDIAAHDLELTKTVSGKIRRTELRDHLREG